MLHKPTAIAACISAALLVPAAPAAAAAPACHVAYTTYANSTGFTANIVITNVGDAPLYGWTLKFQLPAGQSVVQGWGAIFREKDGAVTADNLDYNRDVWPLESVWPGFNGAGPDAAGRPTWFTVNDLPCTT